MCFFVISPPYPLPRNRQKQTRTKRFKRFENLFGPGKASERQGRGNEPTVQCLRSERLVHFGIRSIEGFAREDGERVEIRYKRIIPQA